MKDRVSFHNFVKLYVPLESKTASSTFLVDCSALSLPFFAFQAIILGKLSVSILTQQEEVNFHLQKGFEVVHQEVLSTEGRW